MRCLAIFENNFGHYLRVFERNPENFVKNFLPLLFEADVEHLHTFCNCCVVWLQIWKLHILVYAYYFKKKFIAGKFHLPD